MLLSMSLAGVRPSRFYPSRVAEQQLWSKCNDSEIKRENLTYPLPWGQAPELLVPDPSMHDHPLIIVCSEALKFAVLKGRPRSPNNGQPQIA